MKQLLVCSLLLGLVSLPLMAQDHVEVFGGYQYLHLGSASINGQTASGSQGFNGWNAGAQANLSGHFGVEGDFGGSYATISGISTRVYTYTGGPVVFAHVAGLKPFVHALFGGVKLSGSESGVTVSKTGYTTLVGAGIDAKIKRALAWRVAQVDWLYYHLGSSVVAGVGIPSISSSSNVRISTGIVL
ncbi:MAG TPA: outer membrane beta-barrel protein, partial [Terriglobales bacterium]|nr:outer membrane beta-barrel protein [Terriglobales bacterium]